MREAAISDGDDPSAHYLRAQALLREGAFEQGWREYEWRLKIPGAAGGIPPDDWPRWDGAPTDRRVLIFCDQGRGDIIQFARYIPWVADRCADLAVCCPSEMWPVLRQFPRVRTLAEQWYQAGPCAAYVPIGSLPLVFATRLETIPAPVPYLRAEPHLAATWRARLDRLLPQGQPRVGLVWAGNPSHFNDAARSLALDRLRPLLEQRGISFVALQRGAAMSQLGGVFSRAPLANAGAEIRGFADTIAILAGLDLLVSVDTSVAHLAGAMGRPVWLLLPHPADWRWLADRETSPWYPTARLFRQTTRGDWDPAIQRAAAALQAGAFAGTTIVV